MKRNWLLALALATSSALAADTLTFATGDASGTYSSMFKSIQALCGDKVQLVEKNTSGCDENIDLLTEKKVDGAFCQPDTLQMAAMNDARVGPEQVRALLVLHPEEVHIFAAKELSKNVGGWTVAGKNFLGSKVSLDNLSDLEGVKIGAWGGGFTSARAISYLGGVKYEPVQFKDRAAAFAALDRGEVAAVIAVGGQPLSWAKDVNSAKYKLLRIDGALADRVKVYAKAKLNYRNLNAQGLDTVAPRAVLLVRNYQSAERKRSLSDLKACVVANESALKEGTGHHPKWSDVDFKAESVWPLYVVEAQATPVVPAASKAKK